MHYFRRLPDPRRQHRRLHRLLDIVVSAICAVLCGADNWPEIATFGQRRQDWLKRFLALPHGIPSHDTFERVFDRLDPQAFQACSRSWIAAWCVHLEMPHLAIDGKTLRHSGRAGLGPLHVVSARATAQHLVLGQEVVAEKSNAITAIPRLLELLDLTGALVTLDAMGCQTTIAAQIIAQGGDYVLAVKDNQPTLYAAVQQVFDELLSADRTPWDYRTSQRTERNHGRTEAREYHVVSLPADLAARFPEWKGLRSLGMVLSERQVGDREPGYEARFFLSSLPPRVRRFAQAVRQHWGIENALHWHMYHLWRRRQSPKQTPRRRELRLAAPLGLGLAQAPSREKEHCLQTLRGCLGHGFSRRNPPPG